MYQLNKKVTKSKKIGLLLSKLSNSFSFYF